MSALSVSVYSFKQLRIFVHKSAIAALQTNILKYLTNRGIVCYSPPQ